jgi:hypothetical protein
MDKMDLQASLTRVRRLQKLCSRDDLRFSALLFVAGVDGQFNWGSTVYILISYKTLVCFSVPTDCAGL